MCCQRNPFYSTMLLYTYISRFSVTPTISNPAELPPPTLFPNRSSLRFQLLSQMAHVCFHRRKWVHTRLSEKDRTQGHTRRNRGRFERGGITTLDTYCTFTNIPGPGIRTAYFAAFGSWPGVLPKNAESLRNSDALMRVAVPRRRGPAGLRGLFSFLTKLRLVRPIPETSFSSPDAPACAVPAQAAFPLALSRLGAVQGFSVLSLCLTPFLDFGDKKGR